MIATSGGAVHLPRRRSSRASWCASSRLSKRSSTTMPGAARLHAHLAAERRLQRVARVVEGGPLVGVDPRRPPRPRFWLAGQPNPVLGLADRPPPRLRFAGEAAADVVAGGAEDRAAVAPRSARPFRASPAPRRAARAGGSGWRPRGGCGRPAAPAPLWSGRDPRPGRRRLSPPRPGSGPRAPCSRSAPPAAAPARPGRGRPPGPSPGRPAGRRASGARRRPVRSCRRRAGGPAAAGRRRWPRSRRPGPRARRGRSGCAAGSGSA